MSRKNDANKYWIYGEDAALAAQFTAYLAKVLKNRRANYIRRKSAEQAKETSYEELEETAVQQNGGAMEDELETRLLWEAIKQYLPRLTPQECETMISLYINRLTVKETAAKLDVAPPTVTIYRDRALAKIRKELGEDS